jgi:ribosomal protein S18 acetylase RimI-like enzyme
MAAEFGSAESLFQGTPPVPFRTDALDNPVWHSLHEFHRRFASAADQAVCLLPQIGWLAGISEQSVGAYADLQSIAGDRTVALLQRWPVRPPRTWKLLQSEVILQMSAVGAKWDVCNECVVLSRNDAPDMISLARLTQPGPFETRTCELGHFVGIRKAGELVAMAGQRLRMHGLTEIGAVCTHPAHAGRQYASSLLRTLLCEIASRHDMAFLHVKPGNTRAVRLYESVGFVPRAQLWYAHIRCETA